jgi:hypothetical protein
LDILHLAAPRPNVPVTFAFDRKSDQRSSLMEL